MFAFLEEEMFPPKIITKNKTNWQLLMFQTF